MTSFRPRLLSSLALQAEAQTVDFGLSEAVVPIRLWQGPGHNLITINGKLTLGGQPVAGAALRLDNYELPLTSSDGAYSFLYDQTNLGRRTVRVTGAGKANVDGQLLSTANRRQLSSASATVDAVFLLMLDQQPQLARGATNVKISGRLTFSDKKTPVPPIALWDYVLSGTLRDTNHKPIANAIVSITSPDGEQTALSNVTGNDGAYTIHFFPDSGDHYQVRVGLGDNLYRSFEEIAFRSNESATMDLVVSPANGAVTGTGKNGQLVAKEEPGAEYIGTMTGLANAQGPIAADVAWPDEQGQFSITIPTVNFTGPVSFYQAQLRFTSAAKQVPGGPIAASIQPKKLTADMPQGVHPLTVSG